MANGRGVKIRDTTDIIIQFHLLQSHQRPFTSRATLIQETLSIESIEYIFDIPVGHSPNLIHLPPNNHQLPLSFIHWPCRQEMLSTTISLINSFPVVETHLSI